MGRRRTFSDQGPQLALPLAAPATHVAGVHATHSRAGQPLETLFIEPSAHHVEHALRRGGAAVTTLALLEARLVRALMPSVRVADAALARVVLRMAAIGLPSLAVESARASLAPADLLDAVDGAITALHAADVDGDHLERAARTAAPGVRARAALLAEVMTAHEQALAELGLCDRRALAPRLARALAAEADLAAIDEALAHARVVELRNFAALPPARLAWLEQLHRLLSFASGRVVIHSATARASLLLACGLDDPRERIAARLEARFAEQAAAPELVHEPPGAGSGPLARVADRLFSSTSESTDAPVELIVAASAHAQAEHAAGVAARALAAGVAPEQIVIALPSHDEAVMRPLRRALGAASVPFYEGRGAPPTDTLAVATLLRLLRAIDDRPRKDLLIDVLRGVPSAGPRGLRIRTADALAGIAGGDLRRDGPTLLAAVEDDESRAFASRWCALLTVPPRPPFSAALAHLRVLGEALGFPSSLGRFAADVVQSGDRELLSALAHDLSAWASLAAATDEMARALELAGASDLPLEWSDLAHELDRALSARALVPGHRAGAIAIERIRDRLGLDAEVVILLEAHDGALPARGGADPLLSRGLLDALRVSDPRRAPPPASLAGAVDLLSAIDAIGRASREVVVIHRGVDDSGRTQLPGALPLELARVSTARARVVIEKPVTGRLSQEAIAPRVDAERARARAFAAATGNGELTSPFAGAIHRLEPNGRALLAQKLGDSPATALSVSAAEALLACPFVVFAERILRARPKDELADDGGARELGDLAHRALLEAYRAMAAGEHDYAAVVRRVLDEAPATSVLQRVRHDRLHSDLVATIAQDLERAAVEQRTFEGGEIAFGDGATWPALELAAGSARLFLRGQLDRVDRTPDGAMVIDYKSRRVAGVTTPAFFERHLRGSAQIALYARVAKQNLAPTPGRVLARFVAYRDRAIPDKPVGFAKRDDGSIWASQVGDAGGGKGPGAVAEALAREVSAMRDGAVPARRNANCHKCAQRVACRVPPVVLEEPPE